MNQNRTRGGGGSKEVTARSLKPPFGMACLSKFENGSGAIRTTENMATPLQKVPP